MKILEFGYMHVNKIDIFFFVFFEIMEIFVTPNMALRPFIGLSPDPCAELHNTKPSSVQKG
jgi:hypothetical protein